MNGLQQLIKEREWEMVADRMASVSGKQEASKIDAQGLFAINFPELYDAPNEIII